MQNEIETITLNKNYDTAIVIDEVDNKDEIAIVWITDSDNLPFIFNCSNVIDILIPAIKEEKIIKHNTKTNNLYIYDKMKKIAVIEQYEDGYYTIDTIRLKYRQHHSM